MEKTIVIDIYIIWTIAAPLLLIATVLWQENRITELRKELTDVRDALGRRIVNSRDEIYERIDRIEADQEFMDNEQEEMRGNIDIINDRVSVLEFESDPDNDIELFESETDEEYNRKLHEVIDSLEPMLETDEEKGDGIN